MIYVIVNQTHNWDDPLFETIEYVGTSLEETEAIWEKYYSHMSTMDNSKYYYGAELREYPDGYFLHTLEQGKSRYKILKIVDNTDE